VASGRHKPADTATATASSAAASNAAVQPAPAPPVAPATPAPGSPASASADGPIGASAAASLDASTAARDGGGHEIAVAPATHGAPAPEDEAPPEAPAAEGETKDHAPAKLHGVLKLKPQQFSVLVKSDPEGSHVANGHQSFGTTPVTLKLRPGSSYDLTFTKPGYAPLLRHYRPDAHGPQTLRVSLKKAPETHKPAAAPAPAPKPPAPKSGFFSR
jgi:hypothetical protein